VADPDLELRGKGEVGGGPFVLLALPAFLSSVIFPFFTQNKVAVGRGAGSPRSATVSLGFF